VSKYNPNVAAEKIKKNSSCRERSTAWLVHKFLMQDKACVMVLCWRMINIAVGMVWCR